MSFPVVAGAGSLEVGGHTKLNVTTQTYPDDSVVRDLIGPNSIDAQAELRLNVEWRREGWSFDAGWQVAALAGDSLDLSGLLPPEAQAFFSRLPNDDRRLFDLTHIVSDSGEVSLLHRLDRLWLGYASDRTVVRFGRQALSWGNGLFYAPMDLVNPFDPSSIDTEYKPGDDMLYAQVLRSNGHDVEGAIVFRRNLLSGDVDPDQATVAVKYHGFAGDTEYDVLIADNYGDPVFGLGTSRGIGGALWSADLVVTDTPADTTIRFVTNLSYSWTFGGRNMSGVVEYHFNGFGQSSGRYAPADLAANPELFQRLLRNQVYTLGRNYLAGSVMIEMTPLWTLTPVLLANIDDPSALLQLTTRYSVADNMSLLGSVNIPLGASGTEFGGIESALPGRTFATGPGVFAQFAWYF